MSNSPAFHIFPLGDSALTVELGNRIDETINNEVISRFRQLQEQPFPGTIEVVPAYSSFTVFYDLITLRKIVPAQMTVFDWMKEKLEQVLEMPAPVKEIVSRQISIPVCYEGEYAPDLRQLALAAGMSVEEVIHIHSSKIYKVFMLGFLPGFAYLGEIDDRIKMSRKPQPANVASGSVGIAGTQTGIYPMASPGGWQIIGRTPFQLFDASKVEPSLLKAGDIVQFTTISRDEFKNY